MNFAATSTLRVIGIRYWDDQLTQGDDSALDAYKAARAYAIADAAVSHEEVGSVVLPSASDPVMRLGLLNARIAECVARARARRDPVLITGGCCSHAVGILGGMQAAHGSAARIGVIWLDAHGDFNTPSTTVSGGLYGMPLAVCAGLGLPVWREMAGLSAPIPTDRIMLVDGRNLDDRERQLLDYTAVMRVAARPGQPGRSFHEALAELAGRTDLLYLHVDTDVLDPEYVPTVHLGEPNGPSLEEVCALLRAALATGKVAVATIASIRNFGAGREVSVASAVTMIRTVLDGWRHAGMLQSSMPLCA